MSTYRRYAASPWAERFFVTWSPWLPQDGGEAAAVTSLGGGHLRP
ncbi:hypothetical protein AB0E67_16900 [Streptomyces sp. NPDC032161]